MTRGLICSLCVYCALTGAQQIQHVTAELTLDGKLGDPYWQAIPASPLAPARTGIPAEMGGEVRAGVRGGYLCLAARLPEPGGKVLARSIGRNPVWEKDALESPEVEDRIVFALRYRSAGGAERNVTIAINPWGAFRMEDGSKVVPTAELLRAVQVIPEGWNVEAAAPLGMFDFDWAGSPKVQMRAERIRARRPLAPEFRWSWPAGEGYSGAVLPPRSWATADLEPPVLQPPALGNTDPPLEVGRVLRVPSAVAKWDDPAWSNVPEFLLARNEPWPRAPRYGTRVKWVHDGRRLALHFRMDEPEPVVARAGGRDSAVTGDDHVAVYLATSGSAFLEIAVNTVGAIRDAVGSGPRSMGTRAAWNGDIEVQTDIRHGHWLARINIPLEQCAAALGETGVPRNWRILVARHRAPRPGEAAETSTLPVLDGASNMYAPVRYQALVLRDAGPAEVKLPRGAGSSPPAGLAGELAALEPNVWSALDRRYHGARTMLQRYMQARTEEAVLAERRAWEQVKTREDWERFRDERIKGLRESMGQFPPQKPPLDIRVSARHKGDGYVLENLVFQSRPGFYVAANLYLPERATPPIPAIIIVHSQHFPKTQGELHDMGELWARTGCAVLIMERPGYGERAETNTWYRQAYASRFTFTKQLFLVGESYSGWAAWDIIRSVDFLHDRPEVDKSRIILLGSVAGGGEPAGVAAALDPRITAVAPFNYDQGHVRVHGDSPGQIAKQFSPWLVAASVAPRKFIRAFEFGWEGAEESDYLNLWVDGMERSRKVWGFYGALENLASSQAYGLIRLSMERVSHCFSIGPQQREPLYAIFNRWFNIPFPSQRDLEILPDSQLSTNPVREEARRQEAARRRPHRDLLSIPPELSAQLNRRKMHQIAYDMGRKLLEEARKRLWSLEPKQRAQRLRDELKAMLGPIEPAGAAKAEKVWGRALSGAEVEAISLSVEDGIRVPLLLLRPAGRQPAPVVVAVAHSGKERFLANRAKELEELLRAEIAVCLPDVRGTGETASSSELEDPDTGPAIREFDLSRSLLGSRLKDLRTVLGYLRTRADIDRQRIAVWGDSFAPANPKNLWLDEIEFEAGPQIQHAADPLGAHLALLAALYEEDVRAVAAEGGLAGYLSVLEDAFTYVPMDVIVWGILKSGDIADVAGTLAPRLLTLTRLVNGRNILVEGAALEQALAPARRAYREAHAPNRLMAGAGGNTAAWLIGALK